MTQVEEPPSFLFMGARMYVREGGSYVLEHDDWRTLVQQVSPSGDPPRFKITTTRPLRKQKTREFVNLNSALEYAVLKGRDTVAKANEPEYVNTEEQTEFTETQSL